LQPIYIDFVVTKNEDMRELTIPTIPSGMFSFTRPHIFHLLTEEGVAAMFLRAVASDVEQARAFVSKNSAVDLDALHNIMGHSALPITSMKKASADRVERRTKTQTILLQNCILHLHMVEEPDQFGPWKIYGVDKEAR